MTARGLWFMAWAEAEEREAASAIDLAEEETTPEGDGILNELAAASLGKKRKANSGPGTRIHGTPGAGGAAPNPQPSPRTTVRLQDLSWLETTRVVTENPSGVAGGEQQPTHKPLNEPEVGGQRGSGGNGKGRPGPGGVRQPHEPQGAIRLYSQQDIEEAGYAVLAHVLNGDGSTNPWVADLRTRRGFGADACVTVDDLKKFVEMKAFAGGLPSAVPLTRAEFERA
ncbi:MAG: hypothetical protein EG822_06665 [Deltaproteobacteria bacterium]|nr:hypothetical protein [Deltaproteobacteria bacterium]TLN01503.1 MAG: hypothetical protein FDZ73_15605 [bacterium]